MHVESAKLPIDCVIVAGYAESSGPVRYKCRHVIFQEFQVEKEVSFLCITRESNQ
jgi:hypothetical protein